MLDLKLGGPLADAVDRNDWCTQFSFQHVVIASALLSVIHSGLYFTILLWCGDALEELV